MKTKESMILYRKYRLRVINKTAFRLMLYFSFFSFGVGTVTTVIFNLIDSQIWKLTSEIFIILIVINLIIGMCFYGRYKKLVLYWKVLDRTLSDNIRKIAEKDLEKASKIVEKQRIIKQILS